MSTTGRVLVIAEAGVNHNGSLAIARDLIDAAVWAGADIVKFQTFKAESLVTRSAKKAGYQEKLTDIGETQFEMLLKLELSYADFENLSAYCEEKGIEFLSTAFDESSLDFLVRKLGMRRIKIPSGDLSNGPLLAAAARTCLPLILSTGMADLSEVEEALDVIAASRHSSSINDMREFHGAFRKLKLAHSVSILHCTTEYPAAPETLNLRSMTTLGNAFSLPIGLSDHSSGTLAPVAAVAMGATIIEKHFTLNRDQVGPDHKASLDAHDLKKMISDIRCVESMLGSSIKSATVNELDNAKVARRSLTAATNIKRGDYFSAENLTLKRPGNGMSPMRYWELISKPATRDYEPDDLIVEST